jgi:ACR3 family arsenite efflux pump ArsB
MWEKLNKLPVQILIAVLVIILSYGLLYLLSFKEIPQVNHDVIISLISGVIGSCLTPVIGWLYTLSKGSSATKQQPDPSSGSPNAPKE